MRDDAALLLSLLFVVGLRQKMLLCIMHKPRHLMWILSGVYVGCSATFIELPSSPAAAAAAAATGSHLASSIEKLCAYLCVCVCARQFVARCCLSNLPTSLTNWKLSLSSLSLSVLSRFSSSLLCCCCSAACQQVNFCAR